MKSLRRRKQNKWVDNIALAILAAPSCGRQVCVGGVLACVGRVVCTSCGGEHCHRAESAPHVFPTTSPRVIAENTVGGNIAPQRRPRCSQQHLPM